MEDQRLLDKALQLLPADLYQTKTEVTRTVHVYRSGSRAVVEQTADYTDTELTKGSRVCLDFGDHQVGYLTLKLGYRGSHPDAPVWLRLHFAENPVELLEDVQAYHGWICSSWIEEEQIHVDVVPSELKLPRRYAFRYVLLEVLDISTKFTLRLEHAECTAVSSVADTQLADFKA